MKRKRREFIKLSGLTWLGLAGGGTLKGFASTERNKNFTNDNLSQSNNDPVMGNINLDEKGLSIIGLYGSWATSLNENKLPSLSFRRKEWVNLEAWQTKARKRVMERMAIPDIGKVPAVNLVKQYSYDGLHIEELTWQLPYGRPTEAILLKPLNAKGKLPAILAFHDHGGNKYFGTRKITKHG